MSSATVNTVLMTDEINVSLKIVFMSDEMDITNFSFSFVSDDVIDTLEEITSQTD